MEMENDRKDAAKEAIWELILWLWGAQCSFMAAVKTSNRLMRD